MTSPAMPGMSLATGLFATPIHHIGYAVDDLDAAIATAVKTLGIGPFFVLRDIPLIATSHGEPATFQHSAAFAYRGDTGLELMQIDRTAPERVSAATRQLTPGLNHIAWAVPSLADANKALDEAGLPAFLHATVGEVELTMHDTRQLHGHNIEVHQDSPGFRAHWAQIRAATDGWDGRDPLREMS
jgi:catechol 2,3-dioxygenase-like lactoylglutathione lyase family enzyme